MAAGLLFEALDRTLSGATGPASQTIPPVQRVLAHEKRYWAATMPDVDPALLQWTAAAATIAGADIDDEAHAPLAAHPSLEGDDNTQTRQRLIDWWADLVPGARRLNPLRPDRLGEHLAAQTLNGLGALAPAVMDRILSLPSDRQLAPALDLIARSRPADPALAALTGQAVIEHLVALAGRAQQAAHPEGGGRVDRAISEAVLRSLSTDRLTRLIPDDTTPKAQIVDHDEMSRACYTLGDLARESGRVDDARTLLSVALRIDELLATLAPDDRTHRADVAVAHGKVADLDAAAGRREQVSSAEPCLSCSARGCRIRRRSVRSPPPSHDSFHTCR
jgi:hypothetical protein